MRTEYHILNGTSLREQFPKSIQGEIIVVEECLVDGDVRGDSLEELFNTRAQFISQNYSDYNEQDYYEKTVPGIRKIQRISDHSIINVWFEDDLFCQVNFWFVVHLLNSSKLNNATLFLVRPVVHNEYGFGGLNESELITIYRNRKEITEHDLLGKLWNLYQNENEEGLIEAARQLENSYPFILSAIEAHIERRPKNGRLGRPKQSLVQIMKDLNTKEFGPIFSEFNKRESIYGFGDLQVKRFFDELTAD